VRRFEQQNPLVPVNTHVPNDATVRTNRADDPKGRQRG
jgi:hypothetical protein